MRPLNLVIEGFESYCNRTVIDFSKLGEQGLYLVKGKTGAGKTTIFDAITYALYGEPSGGLRDESMLRSTYADENTKTMVELLFEVSGHKYKITRNPTYLRKAKKGDGLTEEKGNATIEFFDGRPPVEGITKVNAEVFKILKLKKDQFTQIAMIAQGEFQKFLLSEVKEKNEIFKILFRTENYEKLRLRLKDDMNKEDANYKKIAASIEQYLFGITFDGESPLYQRLVKLQESKVIREEDIQFLKMLVEEDNVSLSKLTKEISDNESKRDTVNTDLEKARQKTALEGTLATTVQSKKEKEDSLSGLKSKLTEANSKEDDKKKKEQEKILLKNSLPNYEELTKLQDDISKKGQTISSTTSEINKLDAQISEENGNIDKDKRELEGLKNAGEKLIELKNKQTSCNTEKEDLEAIKNQLETLTVDLSSHEKLKDDFNDASDKLSEATALYNEKRQVFLRNQAGFLAKDLEEGKPCPVCGSIHHPQLAVMEASTITKEQLDKEEQAVKKLENEANSLSEKTGVSNNHLQELSKAIDSSLAKYLKDVSVKKLDDAKLAVKERIAVLISELKTLAADISTEENNKARKEALEQSIPADEASVKNKGDKKSKLETEKSADEATLKSLKENYNSKKAELMFENEAQARQHLVNLADMISGIEKEMADAKAAVDECEKSISGYDGQISSLQDQLKTYGTYNQKELEDTINDLDDKLKKAKAKRDSINSRLSANEKSVSEIERKSAELIKVSKRLAMIEHLYKTSNGQVGGEKIMLETYVHMRYLEKILVKANARLRTMTNGVYQLVCPIAKNGNAQVGLDLYIKDTSIDAIRPVEGLSGGEKFQASLALALGLADEIQESSNGITLESMFIDEGFATLDSDSLKMVMKTLTELSSNNKLIGLISHVNGIDSFITKSIEVSKENGISSARINLD